MCCTDELHGEPTENEETHEKPPLNVKQASETQKILRRKNFVKKQSSYQQKREKNMYAV